MPSPSIFEKLELRNVWKYKNLAQHVFSMEEIDWMCSLLLQQSANLLNKAPIYSFAERYSISKESFLGWVKKFHDGAPIAIRRCSPLLDSDEIGARRLQAFIKRRMTNTLPGEGAILEEFTQAFDDEVQESIQQRTLLPAKKFKMRRIDR